jgi:hypothetical protein
MVDFNLLNKKKLNLANVREELNLKGYNDIDLCYYYISNFKGIGIPFISDLRYDDKNSSMNTNYTKSGLIQISDFGYRTGMSIIDYIMEKYNLEYLYCLDKICIDFNLTNIEAHNNRINHRINPIPKPLNINTKIKQDVIINIKRRRFEKKDVEYWGAL